MKKSFLILSTVFSICLLFSAANAQNSKNNSNSAGAEYNVGDLVEAADYRGRWYRSKIVDVDNGKYRVHFFGWSDSWDEWVTSEKIRNVDDEEFGSEVEVEQEGVWHPAIIVDSRYNREHLVVYSDYTNGEKEEWVLNDRIRGIGDGNSRRSGRYVEVLYGNKWVPAQIIKRRPGEVYIHYVGESDTWNTWISEDKVRKGKR